MSNNARVPEHLHRTDKQIIYGLIESGRLVYIGVTCNPVARMGGHRFFPFKGYDISMIEIESHDDRSVAEKREYELIAAWCPAWNIKGKRPMINYDKLQECAEAYTLFEKIWRPGEVPFAYWGRERFIRESGGVPMVPCCEQEKFKPYRANPDLSRELICDVV